MIKVLVIGDSQSGKSAFVGRFCEDTFIPSYEPTKLELKVNQFEYEKKKYKLQVIDFGTSNVTNASKTIIAYLKQADALILAYDVTNPTSFENLKNVWFSLAQKAPNKTVFIIIGCKNDLEPKKQVSSSEVQQFCEESPVPLVFFETSAKFNTNIRSVFEEIVLNCEVKNDASQILHRRTQSALPLGQFFQGIQTPRNTTHSHTTSLSVPTPSSPATTTSISAVAISAPTSPISIPTLTIESPSSSPVQHQQHVELEKENSNLKAEVGELQKEVDILQRDFSSKKLELKQQITQLQEEVSRVKELQDQNSKLELENKSLKQKMMSASESTAAAAAPMNENEEEYKSKISSLEQELQTKTSQIASLQQQLKENAPVATASHHNSAALLVIDQLKGEINEYEMHMEQLKVDMNKLKKHHIEQVKMLKQSHEIEKQVLQDQIQGLKQEKDKQNEQLQKLLKEKAQWEQERFSLQSKQVSTSPKPIPRITSPAVQSPPVLSPQPTVPIFMDTLPVMDTQPQHKLSLSELLCQGDASAKENLLLIISEEEFSNLDPITGIQKSIIHIMKQFKRNKSQQHLHNTLPLILNAQLIESLMKLFTIKFYNPWFFSKADAWDVIVEIYNLKDTNPSMEMYIPFKEGVEWVQKEVKGLMNESHVSPLRMNMIRCLFMKWIKEKQIVNGLFYIFSHQNHLERFYQRDAPVVQKRHQVEAIDHLKVLNAVSLDWVPISSALK